MALLNGFVPKTFRLSLRIAALDDPLTASGRPCQERTRHPGWIAVSGVR